MEENNTYEYIACGYDDFSDLSWNVIKARKAIKRKTIINCELRIEKL